MRGICVALLITVWAPLAGGADFTVADLMRALAEVPAAEARFTETKHMSVLRSPLMVNGRLVYVRPGRIERHVLWPYDERTVVDRDRVTIENRSRKTSTTLSLEAVPAAYALAESLRATLAGDLASLQAHFSVELRGRADDWSLTLTPRDAGVASLVTSVRIGGVQARILRFDVREANGDYSTMTISDDKP